MKFVLALLALMFLAGCSIEARLAVNNNPSPLDGQPNVAGSYHCGHVRVGRRAEFITLDTGRVLKFFFTRGTDPYETVSDTSGKICVAVPSHEDNDIDNTYYFESFDPDTK